ISRSSAPRPRASPASGARTTTTCWPMAWWWAASSRPQRRPWTSPGCGQCSTATTRIAHQRTATSRRARLRWQPSPRAGDRNRPARQQRGHCCLWREEMLQRKTPQRGHSYAGFLRNTPAPHGRAGPRRRPPFPAEMSACKHERANGACRVDTRLSGPCFSAMPRAAIGEVSVPTHETYEVDQERAESANRCNTSNPALWRAERKQIARLDLRAVPIQLAGGFLDPKKAQSPLGNGSNTLRPIVGMFVRSLCGADMLPVGHLIALSVCVRCIRAFVIEPAASLIHARVRAGLVNAHCVGRSRSFLT